MSKQVIATKERTFDNAFSKARDLLMVLFHENRISKNTFDLIFSQIKKMDDNIITETDVVSAFIETFNKIPSPFPKTSTQEDFHVLFKMFSVNGINYKMFIQTES